jgi:hypothetical protein
LWHDFGRNETEQSLAETSAEKPPKKKRAPSPKEPKEPKKPKTKKSPSVRLHYPSLIPHPRAFMSPEKAAADRNALQALGMSVSKKNVDTMNTKKTIVKEVTRKRRLADMQASVTALEEKVGDRDSLSSSSEPSW